MSESSEMSQLQPIGLKNRIDNNLKLSIPKPNINFNIRNYPSTAPATDYHQQQQKRSHQLGDLTMVKNLIRNLERVDDNQDYFSSSPLSSSSPAAVRSSETLFLHINFRILLFTVHFRTFTHLSVY
jgi:hypothetical protein